MISTLISFIKNKDFNLSLLSELLTIPTFAEIESEIVNIDPLKIYKIIDELNYLFGTKLKKELFSKLQEIEKNLDKVWPDGKHERKLIETIWKLLLHSNDEAIKRKIIFNVDSSSMTLAKAALILLVGLFALRDRLFQIYSSINGKIIVSYWIIGSHSMQL